MLDLEFCSVIGDSWGDLAVDIRSLQVIDSSLGPVILGVNGPSGGLLSFQLPDGAGAADLIDSVTYNTSMSYSITGGSLLLETGNGSLVAVLGSTAQDGTFGFALDTDGQIGAATTLGLPDSDSLTGPVIAHAQSGFVFAMNGSDRLQCFAPDANSGYVAGAHYGDTDSLYLQAPVAMETVQLAGKEYLLTLSGAEQGVSAFSIDPATGALSAQGSLGAASGLGMLSDPTAMETLEIDGHCYILVASAAETGESGALSALELHDDGSLSVSDHLIDTLDTRFGRTHSLTSTQIGDWTYVLAGGGDGGLSLFTMTARGQLIHLDSLEDSLDAGLENISALAAISSGDQLDILVSSDCTPGLTRLSASLTDQGSVMSTSGGVLNGTAKSDMLIGGAEDSDLRGGQGDDILVDGWGADRMNGGSGADLFVLNADDARDVITDFDASIDRLDLTAIPMLYDTSQLSVSETAWGAVLRFRGGEETELHSADGDTLTADLVYSAIDWNANRPPMALRSEEADPPSQGDDTSPPEDGSDTDSPTGAAGADGSDGDAGEDTAAGGDGSAQTEPPPPVYDNLSLHGGQNDDSLTGAQGADSLYGEAGADTLVGGDGDDLLLGGSGADKIDGGAGADSIDGGADFDWMDGGTGNDTILGDANGDTIYGAQGNDHLEGQKGYDLLFGDAGDDWMHGGKLKDTLIGGDGADTLNGGFGNDRLEGQNDADLLYGNVGNDWMSGGESDDILWGGNNRDSLYGDAGNDTMRGEKGFDYMQGGTGDDWMDGGNLKDTLLGGEGADTLNGGFGNDRVEGEDGNDLLYGQVGRDHLDGGAQNDTILGGGGKDTLYGGLGDDHLEGENGYDFISGGEGRDWISGGALRDTIFGGDDDDVISGGLGKDKLFGEAGNDTLYGNDLSDTLDGGIGADWIEGGGGYDHLTGGAGSDRFAFDANSGRNEITDFESGTDYLVFDISETSFAALGTTNAARGVWLQWDGGEVLLEGLSEDDISAKDVVFL